VLLFDHLKHVIKVVSHVRLDGDIESAYRAAEFRIDELVERLQSGPPIPPVDAPEPSGHSVAIRSNMEREAYFSDVKQIIDYVVAGDIIQCVYSQRFSRDTFVHPFNVYRTLRTVNPSPYTYYLEMDDHQIVGTSPELLVIVEDGKVSTHPIAGTRRRGLDEDEDRALEAELRADEKEVAEHVMLLDLGRNDIGRVARPGTVRVTQELDVERYSHVMHLVSHVEGDLAEGATSFDAVRATFPAGTVSGAPKIRAMEIISELEQDQRGPYAGALGYFGFGGNMETAITIRTIIMQDGVASVQAGGGIVFDSKLNDEFEETVNKAMGMFTALDLAEERSRAGAVTGGSRGY
ncbi:MAG: anthranilate synthase component I, partial [Chloroflexi bacterium]|nr:anthranilate synthase component I [Chloroflexota bacterium]